MNNSIIPIKIFKPSTNDLTFGSPLYLFFSIVGIKDDPKLFFLAKIGNSTQNTKSLYLNLNFLNLLTSHKKTYEVYHLILDQKIFYPLL